MCDSCKISTLALNRIIDDEDKLILFLQKHGVFSKDDVVCPKCNKLCKLYTRPNFRFRCTNTVVKVLPTRKKVKVTCSYTVGAKRGTFFEHAHLPTSTICQFVTLWLSMNPPMQVYLERELELSSRTVVNWSSFCREVCVLSMVDSSEAIGGPGTVVDVDESKMMKRKYNRGRIIDGQWVFGGVERGSKKTFFVPVQNRTSNVLLEIIQKWILPGTTIMSDCWKTYDCLADEGFQQETVNHSKNFMDPDSGTHTQNIKRRWKDVRASIPQCSRREHFDGYLAEYQFRKRYPDHRDRFHHFFKCMAQVYPPATSNSGDDPDNSDRDSD